MKKKIIKGDALDEEGEVGNGPGGREGARAKTEQETEIRRQMTKVVWRGDGEVDKRVQGWLEWLDVGVVRRQGGECGMLEESEGQGSRLRGERQGGRQEEKRQSGEG